MFFFRFTLSEKVFTFTPTHALSFVIYVDEYYYPPHLLQNIELKVRVESLKKELEEKQQLLDGAL